MCRNYNCPDLRHILRVSQVLGCELTQKEATARGLEKEWMTGPINALRCRITGPYAAADAAERYRKSCEKLGTNYMYLNMIYRIWGDPWLQKRTCSRKGGKLRSQCMPKLTISHPSVGIDPVNLSHDPFFNVPCYTMRADAHDSFR